MEDKLNFSLPKEKGGKSKANKTTITLILLLLVLTTLILLAELSGRDSTNEKKNAALSAEKTKELASKLAQRNLYKQAAMVWQDYLGKGELTDAERAKTLFQIGTLLEKAGLYEQAIESYYRSELTAKPGELEREINVHIQNCFERLGKFSVLRYELMDRTSFKETAPAGSKIVAEIGAEKFTEADIDGIIERAIDNQLASFAAFMTTEQLNEQKKNMLEQYKSPQARNQFLQTWVTEEILYRQALEDGLAEKEEVKQIIGDLTRSLLSQQLINQQLADKIHITETDLQTYYQANRDKFVMPADEDANTPPRQKSFDEARQQVMYELSNQKRQEVQQDYIKQMMDKYNVIIHTSALKQAQGDE
jgi:hypothetical protein